MTLKQVFFYSILLFALGDLLSLQKILALNAGLFIFVLALVMLISSFYCKKQERTLCFSSLVLFFFAVGIIMGARAGETAPNSIADFVGNNGVITGVVIPESYQAREEGFAGFLLETQTFYADGQLHQVNGKLRVALSQVPQGQQLAPGQAVSIAGQLKPLRSLSNPGGIDMLAYDQRRDIYGRLSAKYEHVVLGDVEEGLLTRADRLVVFFKAGIGKVLPQHEQAVLYGMLFGGYEGIDRKLVKEFSATGVIHILAVSGAHVAVAAGFLFWLGGKLKLTRKKVAALTILGVWTYAVLTGLHIPVTRAAIMSTLVLAGLFFGRDADKGSILGIVLLICLICQPLWLLNVSFQLSFLSVLGIIYLQPKLDEKLAFLPSVLRIAFSITISVQLVLLPFLASYFYQVSVIALLANVIIMPLAQTCMILSFAGMLFLPLLPVAANFIFMLVSFVLSVMIKLNALLAGLPFALLTIPHLPAWFWCCYYLLLLCAGNFLPWRFTRKARAVICTGIFVISMAGMFVVQSDRELAVHFVDVGQGDAALLVTKNKKCILLDSGPRSLYGDYDTGARVLLPYLKYYGIDSIDLLILSHGHNDHAGGAAAVAEEVEVKEIWLPKEKVSDDVQRLLAKSKATVKTTMEKGLNKQIDGVLFEVVYAPSFMAQKSSLETSSLIKAVYQEKIFLFTGDAPAFVEVIAAQQLGQVSVLKVSHHGSATSSDPLFLAKTNPALSVISVGRQNSYGHPARQTLERLERQGAVVVRTDQSGAVLVEVKHGKIYWYGYRDNPEFFKR